MKTILSVGFTVLPMIAMAAPSAAELAAQPANQSTTFSTGAPIHSPWVVLQQATANASAGWNDSSTSTVVPSGTSSFVFNITNNSSKTLYVFVANSSGSNIPFSPTQKLCEIPANTGPINYTNATGTNCALARSYSNAGTAYIYVTDTDLSQGGSYSGHYPNCTNTSPSISNPTISPNPFAVINGGIGQVNISLQFTSLTNCSFS